MALVDGESAPRDSPSLGTVADSAVRRTCSSTGEDSERVVDHSEGDVPELVEGNRRR